MFVLCINPVINTQHNGVTSATKIKLPSLGFDKNVVVQMDVKVTQVGTVSSLQYGPEDVRSMLFRNAGVNLRNYVVSQPSKHTVKSLHL